MQRERPVATAVLILAITGAMTGCRVGAEEAAPATPSDEEQTVEANPNASTSRKPRDADQPVVEPPKYVRLAFDDVDLESLEPFIERMTGKPVTISLGYRERPPIAERLGLFEGDIPRRCAQRREGQLGYRRQGL